MTPLERFIQRSRTPFDLRRNNCSHAVLFALQGNEKAEVAFSSAMDASIAHKPILDRATIGALAAGAQTATDCDLGFGVADTPQGQTVVLRAAGAWWRRGQTGAVKILPSQLIAAWSVE